jgi:hypothetical protein
MARHTGPKLELLVLAAIFGDDKAFEESFPPGRTEAAHEIA